MLVDAPNLRVRDFRSEVTQDAAAGTAPLEGRAARCEQNALPLEHSSDEVRTVEGFSTKSAQGGKIEAVAS